MDVQGLQQAAAPGVGQAGSLRPVQPQQVEQQQLRRDGLHGVADVCREPQGHPFLQPAERGAAIGVQGDDLVDVDVLGHRPDLRAGRIQGRALPAWIGAGMPLRAISAVKPNSASRARDLALS